ncbi:nuclear transport factor 2 family protein [Streptomyces sp. NPDC048232]|uniref:nuclear transport factor 2 family protein n=1 Tax=Streptomyces sp. NPDC048232 TaxID=3365520 RepID=UPI003711CAA1
MTRDDSGQGDHAEGNVGIVLTAMRELFADKDLTAIDRYWAEPYIQHSPRMPDGLDTLREVVPGLKGFSWEPQRIAAQGDLVFTHSIVHGWGPGAGPVAIVDIFRLDGGRIVEHWDVVQEIVSPEESVNGNPMV